MASPRPSQWNIQQHGIPIAHVPLVRHLVTRVQKFTGPNVILTPQTNDWRVIGKKTTIVHNGDPGLTEMDLAFLAGRYWNTIEESAELFEFICNLSRPPVLMVHPLLDRLMNYDMPL